MDLLINGEGIIKYVKQKCYSIYLFEQEYEIKWNIIFSIDFGKIAFLSKNYSISGE